MRVPSANGSAKADARPVRGPPWSASSATSSTAGLDVPDEGAVYTPMAGRDRLQSRSDDTVPISDTANARRSRDSAARGQANRPRARPEPAIFQRRDDRRSGRAVAPAPAVDVPAGRRLRPGRAHPFGRRHLRRDGVLRRAAHQGHQHSPGTRWPPDGRAPVDCRPRHEGRLGRSRRRLAGRARADSRDVQPPVRCRRCRCVHIQRRRAAHACCRPGRLRRAGQTATGLQPATVLRNE